MPDEGLLPETWPGLSHILAVWVGGTVHTGRYRDSTTWEQVKKKGSIQMPFLRALPGREATLQARVGSERSLIFWCGAGCVCKGPLVLPRFPC